MGVIRQFARTRKPAQRFAPVTFFLTFTGSLTQTAYANKPEDDDAPKDASRALSSIANTAKSQSVLPLPPGRVRSRTLRPAAVTRSATLMRR